MMHSNSRCEIFMKGAFMSASAASGPAVGVCSYHPKQQGAVVSLARHKLFTAQLSRERVRAEKSVK